MVFLVFGIGLFIYLVMTPTKGPKGREVDTLGYVMALAVVALGIYEILSV